MRVALVSFDMPWSLLGGVEVHTDRLARSLAQDFGDDVTVYTRRPPPGDPSRPYGVVATGTGRFACALLRPAYRVRLLLDRRFARRATRAAARRAPPFDVVHFQEFSGVPAALRGPRRVGTVHVPFELPFEEGRRALAGRRARLGLQALWHRRQQRWAREYLGGLDALVCVSGAVADLLRRDYGASPVVIPNGADPPPHPVGRHEAPRRLGLERFSKVVLFVGRLEPAKRPDRLLPLARDRTGVVFVGDGSLRGVLEAAARRNPNVVLAGVADDAAKSLHYEAADVLALPSQAEAQPIVVLEALAHGTPAYVARPEWIPAGARPYCAFGEPEAGVEAALALSRVPAGVVPTWRDVARRVRALYA